MGNFRYVQQIVQCWVFVGSISFGLLLAVLPLISVPQPAQAQSATDYANAISNVHLTFAIDTNPAPVRRREFSYRATGNLSLLRLYHKVVDVGSRDCSGTSPDSTFLDGELPLTNTSGQQTVSGTLSINSEASNNKFVCFRFISKVGSYKTTIAASTEVISGIDSTPPKVTYVFYYTGTGSERKVYFSARDDDTGDTTMAYQAIDARKGCDDVAVTDPVTYTEGKLINFVVQDNEGDKICFRSTDEAGNMGFKETPMISTIPGLGIRITHDRDTQPERQKSVTYTVIGPLTEVGIHQAFVDGKSSCQASASGVQFNALAIVLQGDTTFQYTSEELNGKYVCLRVTKDGTTYYVFSSTAISGIDRTPPVVRAVFTGTPFYTAQNRTVRVTFSDANQVTVNWTLIEAAGACHDATFSERYQDYTSTFNLVFSKEEDNGKRACIRATDAAGNKAFAASAVVDKIDRTPPSITVTTSTNYSTQIMTVRARDTDSDPTRWSYRFIGDDVTCDGSALSIKSRYSENNTIELSSIIHHGKKVCIEAVDPAGNAGYKEVPIRSGSLDIDIENDGDTNPERSKDVYLVSNVKAETLVYIRYKLLSSKSACHSSTTFYSSSASSGGSPKLFSDRSLGVNERHTFTYDEEANNGKYFCIQVENVDLELLGYYVSPNPISGIDRTAPAITVTNPRDISTAQSKTVSATDGDDNTASPTTWVYKLIAGRAVKPVICSDKALGSDPTSYVEGSVLTFNKQTDNGKKVCFRSTDAAGNKGFASSAILGGIDAIAPTIVVNSPANTDPAQSKTVSAQDDDTGSAGTTWVYKAIPAATTCNAAAMQTGTTVYTEGAIVTLNKESFNGKRVCFQSTDPVGNAGHAASDIIGGIDATPPQITIRGLGTTKTRSRTIRASDTDSTATVWRFRTIPGSMTCNATALSTNSLAYTEGEARIFSGEVYNGMKVCFSSTDVVGNIAYASGEIQGIDLTPPNPTVVGPANTNPARSKTVRGTDDEEGSSIWRYAIVRPNQKCKQVNWPTERATYTKDTDLVLDQERYNNMKVCFRVQDGLKNTTYAESKLIAGIDRTAPNVTVVSPVDTDPAQSKTLSATDGDNNATSPTTWAYKRITATATCGATAMNAGTTDYTEGATVTLNQDTDNNKKICFQSTDVAGNSGYAASSVIGGIDSTAPTITVVNPSTTAARSKTFSASDSEDGTTLVYTLVAGDTSTCDDDAIGSVPTSYTERAAITFNQEKDNGKKICFRSTDAVGNKGFQFSSVITGIDRTGPVIQLKSVSNYTTKIKYVTVTDAEAAGTSTWSYQIIDGSATCQDSALTDPSGYAEGALFPISHETYNGKKICFRSTDGAGNSSFASSAIPGEASRLTVVITNDPDTQPERKKAINYKMTGDQSTVAAYLSIVPQKSSCSPITTTKEPFVLGSSGSFHSIDFTSESNNGGFFCLILEDKATEQVIGYYNAPNAITGIDRTEPDVTVVSPTNTDPATSKTLSATDGDDNAASPTTWVYQLIDPAATCGSAVLALSTTLGSPPKSYTEGTDLVLDQASANNKKVCFQSTDVAGNSGYAASNVIGGIDSTAPSITISGLSATPAQSKTASAVDDDKGVTAWKYKILTSSETCDATSMASTTNVYTEGEDIPTFTAETDNGKKVCFESTDAVGNVTYAAATVSGIDTNAPSITVTGPTNTDPATSKTVSAHDNDDKATTWVYNLVASSTSTCDDTTIGLSPIDYTERATLTFNQETDNKKKVCFRSTDQAGNKAFAFSEDIDGIDTNAPSITVTGPTNTDPATSKTLSATDGDDNTASPTTWVYQLIDPAATCGSAVLALSISINIPPKSYTEGTDLVLDQESANNKKVCFQSTDAAGNSGHTASSVIGGIDRTAPKITVTGPTNTDPATSKTLSATDGDDNVASPTTWVYQLIDPAATCGSAVLALSTTLGFPPKSYTEGTDLVLDQASANNKKACFQSTDVAGNSGYTASNVIGGIDRTAPSITVTGPTNTDPATSKTVSAHDNDDKATTWVYNLVASSTSTCDDTTIGLSPIDYTERATLTFNQETDNKKKVCFRSTDQAGNKAFAFSEDIDGIDTNAPSITVTGPTNTDPATSKTVSAHDNDDKATTWVYNLVASSTSTCDDTTIGLSPIDYTERATLTFNQETDNKKKVCFRSTDQAGNKAFAFSEDIDGIDTNAPSITVTGPTNTDPATSKTVSAHDNDDKATTWVYNLVASSTSTCDDTTIGLSPIDYTERATLTFNQETDNKKKVCFRSTDQAGNKAFAFSEDIDGIDTNAPSITVTGPTNTDPATSKTVSAHDNDDKATTWVYNLVASSTSTCDDTTIGLSPIDYTERATLTFNQETDNKKKVCFRSTDQAGNKAFAFSEDIDGIDTNAPSITVTGPTNTDPATSKTVSAHDNDDKATTWVYNLVASSTSTCDDTAIGLSPIDYTERATLTFNQETDNEKKVCFRSTDQAGNKAFAFSEDIDGIDTNAPSITVTGPTNTDPATSKTVSAHDNDDKATTWVYNLVASSTSTCDDTAIGLSPIDYTERATLTFNQETDNKKKVCFRSTDQAGNKAFAFSEDIDGIDTNAPSITVTGPTNTDPATSKTVSAHDNDDKATTWVYNLVASSTSTCDDTTIGLSPIDYTERATLTFNQETDNKKKVCFRSTDQAGNKAFAFSEDIDGIDTNAPSITVTGPTNTDPATSKTVSAHDNDDKATTWVYNLVASSTSTCDDTTIGLSPIDYTERATLTFNQETDNKKKVCFRSTDQAGNKAFAFSEDIDGIDTNAPSITVTGPTNTDPATSKTVSAHDNDDKATTWVYNLVASSTSTCDDTAIGLSPIDYTERATLTFNQETDNKKKVCFRSTDQAGNKAFAFSEDIDGIDTNAPSITVTGPTNTDPATSKTVSAHDNDDKATTWVYNLVASSTSTCDDTAIGLSPIDYTERATLTFNQETDNEKKVCFRSTDQAGNKAFAFSEDIDGIDTNAPTPPTTPDPDKPIVFKGPYLTQDSGSNADLNNDGAADNADQKTNVKDATFTISYEAGDIDTSPVASCEYKVGSGAYATFPCPQQGGTATFSATLAAGDNDVTVKITDSKAGSPNTGEQTTTVTLDETPPTITTPAQGTLTTTSQGSLYQYTPAADSDGITITDAGTGLVAHSINHPITVGIHPATVRATDLVGNRATGNLSVAVLPTGAPTTTTKVMTAAGAQTILNAQDATATIFYDSAHNSYVYLPAVFTPTYTYTTDVTYRKTKKPHQITVTATDFSGSGTLTTCFDNDNLPSNTGRVKVFVNDNEIDTPTVTAVGNHYCYDHTYTGGSLKIAMGERSGSQQSMRGFTVGEGRPRGLPDSFTKTEPLQSSVLSSREEVPDDRKQVRRSRTTTLTITLVRTSRSPYVLEAQKMLNMYTTCPVAIEGAGSFGNETTYLGFRTERALQCFQRYMYLPITGHLTPTTYQALVDMTRSTLIATITFGSRSLSVLQAQRILNHYTPCPVAAAGAGSPGKETDYLGTRTEQALRCFQYRVRLPVTGTLTPKTYKTLVALEKVTDQRPVSIPLVVPREMVPSGSTPRFF